MDFSRLFRRDRTYHFTCSIRGSKLIMVTGWAIDYEIISREMPSPDVKATVSFLSQELPYKWATAYGRMTPHETNILRLTLGSFEYLFDWSSELIHKGVLQLVSTVEDRLVAVHGRSHPAPRRRRYFSLKRPALRPVERARLLWKVAYDRGHFIDHVLDGDDLDINLYAQLMSLSRGWSHSGKMFRHMERYCQRNPGTYCFSRPIYTGLSSHPSVVEFGVLKGRVLWVNSFENYGSPEECADAERLLADTLRRHAAKSDGVLPKTE